MEQYNLMPIGSVISYAGTTTPIGWLLCDGRSITEVGYPDLFKLVGDKLPDLRGEFVRGVDNGRGVDTGRVIGSGQGDLVGPHTHPLRMGRVDDLNWTGGPTQLPPADGIEHADKVTWESNLNTGSETRPRNIALNYIIKAFNVTTDTNTLPIQMAKALNTTIEHNRDELAVSRQSILGAGHDGYIQDEGIKTVGLFYTDKVNGKGYFCIKSGSNVNSSEFYREANLSRMDNLLSLAPLQHEATGVSGGGGCGARHVGLPTFQLICHKPTNTAALFVSIRKKDGAAVCTKIGGSSSITFGGTNSGGTTAFRYDNVLNVDMFSQSFVVNPTSALFVFEKEHTGQFI
ncbi:MAG: phage tail protein [Fusobacteriaceae bacterium]